MFPYFFNLYNKMLKTYVILLIKIDTRGENTPRCARKSNPWTYLFLSTNLLQPAKSTHTVFTTWNTVFLFFPGSYSTLCTERRRCWTWSRAWLVMDAPSCSPPCWRSSWSTCSPSLATFSSKTTSSWRWIASPIQLWVRTDFWRLLSQTKPSRLLKNKKTTNALSLSAF